jgi:hypothetical protein
MARKQLNDLAKIGLGLAAAYGASKVLGKSAEEKGLEIARSETRDLTSDESIAPRRAMASTTSGGADKGFGIDSSMDTSSRSSGYAKEAALNPKTGMYGEPGSLEGFKASEAARKERIAGTWEMSPDSPKAKLASRLNRAKKGKMMKASTGGSVVARGNKLARSKPTKLF